MSLVSSIFSNILTNPEYFGRVWPHLKPEYFGRGSERITYALIKQYVDKYQSVPTITALEIELESKKTLSGPDVDDTKELFTTFRQVPEDLKWLIDTTEKFCQDKAVENATSKIIEIQINSTLPREEQNPKIPGVGVIPDLMRDAISISFDTTVGHDFFEDAETRWEHYNKKVNKIPFSVEMLNRITRGGVARGTLNLIMAGVNVGKSLCMCSLAADYLTSGQNVLYISMEMGEEEVAKRIDANLINISMDDFDTITGGFYKDKLAGIASKSKVGKLIIKQFPTSGAGVNHFNVLMDELKTKKGWTPDVVIVDYLGICCSSRIKTVSENSYALVKAIAEELRGFAVRYNVAVWSGAQTTRAGWDSTDVQMGDIAESAGLAATADFILAMMETEELASMQQYFVKQIKSRYGDKSKWNKFNLGVDKGKQRIYGLDENGQSKPDLDTTSRNMAAEARANATMSMSELTSRQKMENLAADMKF